MWLKGDIHCHSKYSDGDSSVKDVLDEAKYRAGLQFVSITDHDTHFQDHPDRITTWYDPAYVSSSSLGLLDGIEWTTSAGHANIWATHPYDYSAVWAANRNKDPGSAIKLAHDQGALFSYNHPGSDNPWALATSRDVDSVEIWNGPGDFNSNFKATFKFWDGLLNQYGARISAVGSSDMHELHGGLSDIVKFGQPRLWVLAENNAPESILDAIKHGHATISAKGSSPRLDFAADRDANGSFETVLGDIVPLEANATVKFKMSLDGGGTTKPIQPVGQADLDNINARLLSGNNYSDTLDKICDKAHSDDYMLALIKDGLFFKAWLVDQASQDVVVDVPVDGSAKSYYRAELYDNDERLAVTNPIYFNFTNVDHGTAANDTLRGEAASDALYASKGNDLVYGLDGSDCLYGGMGDDTLDGGTGNDRLYGDAGNDKILGLSGADKMYGGTGNDRLWGHADNDKIYGGTGNDWLGGGSGNDIMSGQDGDDILSGTWGLDRMSGGVGNDLFDYNAVAESPPGAANRDVILDYAGVGAAVGDRIDLSTIDANSGVGGNQAFAFTKATTISAGQVHVVASGTNSLIQADIGGAAGHELEILVRNVAANQWVDEDFIL